MSLDTKPARASAVPTELPVESDVKAIARRLDTASQASALDAAKVLAKRAGESGKVVAWYVGQHGIVIAGTGRHAKDIAKAIGLLNDGGGA